VINRGRTHLELDRSLRNDSKDLERRLQAAWQFIGLGLGCEHEEAL